MSEKTDDSEILTKSEKDDHNRRRSSVALPENIKTRSDSRDDGQVLIVLPEKKLPPHIYYARLFVVEVFLFVFTFGMAARIITTQTMYLEKICRYSLHHSKALCHNITEYPKAKNDVQEMASMYSLYGNLIQMVPAAAISLFLSPWGDKYGRKLPILLALSGVILMEVGILVNGVFIEADLNYILLACVPGGIFGGIITIFGMLYSYASENTPQEARTLKFAIIELCFGSGIALGTFTGGQLLPLYGKATVLATSVILHMFCFIVALFFFVDRMELDRLATWRQKVVDLFSVEKFKENVRTSLKKRENRGRTQIFLLFASLSLTISYMISLVEIVFYFCNNMYNWSVPKFTLVTTIASVLTMICMTGFAPLLTKVLRLSDPLLGLIGSVSLFLQALLKAFAYDESLYYIALAVGVVGPFSSLAGRSRISKLVEKDELGKVFSLLAACESVVPIIAATLFTLVYSATLNSFPGLVFFISSVLLAFPIGVFSWMLRISKAPYSKVSVQRLPGVVQEATNGL